MASRVLVSNGAVNINTANGFHQADKYNIGGAGTALTLSTARTAAVTFSTNHNCPGLVVALWCSTAAQLTKSVIVALQQIMGTCTVNSGTDEVTFTGHGFSDGQEVQITAATTQPGGLVVSTSYFARATGSSAPTNTFFLYDTAAHAIAGGSTGKVDITSTGSGTLTLYAVRGTQTKTTAQITDSAAISIGTWILEFTWTAVAVDTTAGKWQFWIYNTGTGTNWQSRSSDGTNMFFVERTDIAATFDLTAATNSDTLVAMSPTTINASASLKAQLGTGDTVNSVCAIIGKSATPVTPTSGNENLIWENSMTGAPSSSYTLTTDGMVIVSAHGGIRVGSVDHPVPNAQRAIISLPNRSVGTAPTGITGFLNNYAYGASIASKSNLFMFGERPTTERCSPTGAISVGATSFQTSDDVSGWNGLRFIIPKKNSGNATGAGTIHTISNVTFSGGLYTVTFSPAIGTAATMANAEVYLLDGRGVLVSGNTTNRPNIRLNAAANFQLDGVAISNTNVSPGTDDSFAYEDAANSGEQYIKNSTIFATSSSQVFYLSRSPQKDFTIDNSVFLGTGMSIVYAGGYSGTYTLQNSVLAVYSSGGQVVAVTGGMFQNNKLFYYGGITTVGTGWTAKNNQFWGIGWHHSGGGSSPLEISGNTYNKMGNVVASAMYVISNVFNWVETNAQFGNEAANIQDIYTSNDYYFDLKYENPTFFVAPVVVNYTNGAPGSYLVLRNVNSVSGDMRTWTTRGTFTTDSPSYLNLVQTQVDTVNTMEHVFELLTQTAANIAHKLWLTASAAATYDDGTHDDPKIDIFVDGNPTTGTPDETVTVTDIDGIDHTYSVQFTPTTDNKKVSIVFRTKTDQANAPVKWSNLSIVPDEWGKALSALSLNISETLTYPIGTIPTPTTDSLITLTEVAVGALTGIAYDGTTITTTEAHTVAEVYQWLYKNQKDNNVANPLSSTDGGSSWNCAADWDNQAALTGGGTITMGSGKTFTQSGSYDGMIIDANHAKGKLTTSALDGHTVAVYNNAGVEQDYQASVTGAYNYYPPSDAAGTWTVVIKKPGYKGAFLDWTPTASTLTSFSPSMPQDLQPTGEAMYTGSSDALCSVSFTGTTEADIVVGNGQVSAQLAYDTVEDALITNDGMAWLAGEKSNTSIATLVSGFSIFMTSGWRLKGLGLNSTVLAFVYSTDGVVISATSAFPVAFLSSASLTPQQVRDAMALALSAGVTMAVGSIDDQLAPIPGLL